MKTIHPHAEIHTHKCFFLPENREVVRDIAEREENVF